MSQSQPAARGHENVYVDTPMWGLGRMVMCHMWCADLDRLHDLASRVGVERRWFQDKPGFPHYDVCKSKRAQAVALGAVEVSCQHMLALAGGRTVPAACTPDGRPLRKAGLCTCAGHCANSPYHERACCDVVWCDCWCHAEEYLRRWAKERGGPRGM